MTYNVLYAARVIVKAMVISEYRPFPFPSSSSFERVTWQSGEKQKVEA